MPGPVLRPLRWPTDRSAVQALDAGFSTSERVRPVMVDDRLVPAYEQISVPVTKQQPVMGPGGDGWPLGESVVAELSGRLVGVLGTHHSSWNNRQILDALYVDAAARRSGVGRALLAAALDAAARSGARELWLETQDVNAPAVHAYQAMGFRLVGLDTSFYAPPYEHEKALFMAHDLTP